MIDKKFIEFIAKKQDISRPELIEKDVLLQGILYALAKEPAFSEEFAFKGGTCLIKCYFGYYRFSEDLDFTYICQEKFKGKSEKLIRKIISQKLAEVLALLEAISEKLGLEFKADKTDSRYVEFGGGNKFVTFKLWYGSLILNQRSFIKIQINFVEHLLYPLAKIKVNPIISASLAEEIRFIFKEYAYLLEQIDINAYSLKEILTEKARAIITRRGIKTRDFVDIYFIQKEGKLGIRSLEKEIIEKTIFMLKYEKYLQNIKSKPEELRKFSSGKEDVLLLKPLSADFRDSLERTKSFLNEVIRKILEKIERDNDTH